MHASLTDDQSLQDSSAEAEAVLLRRLAQWMATVALADAAAHAVRHDGGCGERFFCLRCRHRFGGYRTAEVLPGSGDLILHCEGLRLRPNDQLFPERRDEIVP